MKYEFKFHENNRIIQLKWTLMYSFILELHDIYNIGGFIDVGPPDDLRLCVCVFLFVCVCFMNSPWTPPLRPGLHTKQSKKPSLFIVYRLPCFSFDSFQIPPPGSRHTVRSSLCYYLHPVVCFQTWERMRAWSKDPFERKKREKAKSWGVKCSDWWNAAVAHSQVCPPNRWNYNDLSDVLVPRCTGRLLHHVISCMS